MRKGITLEEERKLRVLIKLLHTTLVESKRDCPENIRESSVDLFLDCAFRLLTEEQDPVTKAKKVNEAT